MNANRTLATNDAATLGISLVLTAADPTACPNDLVARLTDMALVHFLKAARGLVHSCPACSGDGITAGPVQQCSRCGGLFTAKGDVITRTVAETLVDLNYMAANAVAGQQRYFDFVIGGDYAGVAPRRVHGWFCQVTRKVVQWG